MAFSLLPFPTLFIEHLGGGAEGAPHGPPQHHWPAGSGQPTTVLEASTGVGVLPPSALNRVGSVAMVSLGAGPWPSGPFGWGPTTLQRALKSWGAPQDSVPQVGVPKLHPLFRKREPPTTFHRASTTRSLGPTQLDGQCLGLNRTGPQTLRGPAWCCLVSVLCLQGLGAVPQQAHQMASPCLGIQHGSSRRGRV